MINPDLLPTHLALVARRCHAVGPNSSADTFLMTSYLVESLIKTTAITLLAGVRKSSPNISKKFEYELIRADGLGSWEAVIGDFMGQSNSGYVDADLQALLAWLTKRRTQAEDAWAKTAITRCAEVLKLLGVLDAEMPTRPTIRFLFGQLVRIRNKTKAHGAVGPDFFDEANPKFIEATQLLLENCPISSWDWYYLSVREEKATVRAISLRGLSPQHVRGEDSEQLRPKRAGIHFRTHPRGHILWCGELLQSNREYSEFMIPNGGYTDKGVAEFIDYGIGRTNSVSLPQYLTPPAPLPPSATEGLSVLDVFSNVFGNLPPRPTHYVQRPKLENELSERLRDRNHTIITLHGRGGIGKTSLALRAAYQLSDEETPQFDHILWLSARDLELHPSGATDVRRAVSDLQSVAKAVGRLLEVETTVESLASLLQAQMQGGSRGILLIFDNFETLDDPKEVHRFLDTHTHIPNKIMITSRERAFKGDYPIEVGGMEFDEAASLLHQEANSLKIGNIVTDEVVENIFEYTDGHAYVMRVLLGEIAKDGRWVAPKSLVSRRGDLLNVVFERSFNKLTLDGKWVFLCVANWRSVVPELSLLVVLGQRDLDVERGIEECVRLALLVRHEFADESFGFSVPELARLFARKKLEGDPDRLVLQEDKEALTQFGVLVPSTVSSKTTEDVVRAFVEKCVLTVVDNDEQKKLRIDSILESISELWPAAWLGLAQYRQRIGDSPDRIGQALRRAVEERPNDKDVWLERAAFAKLQKDASIHVASMISAVEADPSDLELIRDTAFLLCQYLDAHKFEIPQARRGVYLASVRSRMERLSARLDATGLSRLAWLFLLEGDLSGAWKYANEGLTKDVTNSHCLKIVERLEAQGFQPS